ncbi:TonB-dependent receptor plug domain-containing protein [Labilibacter marinus]|uniref:TonB-dependent receptor plug domain-containing protein n=1 Tax=Labilibacter marinus TaxID=1477105 RepID=UPI00130147BB|nr:TonB-dependent receptor [Labilibacter marinus]
MFDAETRLPVSNVIVFDEAESQIAGTDHDGLVDLSVFNEEQALWFKHPAYELFYLSRNNPLPKAIYIYPKVYTLDEFVVSASRVEESKKNIPYFLETIKPRSIEFKNAATGADILTGTGYVAVQKSQGGGGSPILRGFEANRVLLVMDGVRMNNAIYRSGHLQNSITIDPNILEKTEVLFGPSSAIYGSDALGGVVSYFSKDPILSNDTMVVISGEASLQTMSASNATRTNVNVNAGFKHWASLTSFTYSDFGDIKMGENRPDNAPQDWGKIYHYVGRKNGQDVMLDNPDPNVQLNTGYKQYDVLQKIKATLSPNHAFVLNAQYSTSSNISRFDQLNDYSDDQLKYANYYYGPQDRLFVSANSRYKKETKWFSSLNTIVAYQNIKESRFSRKFGDDLQKSQEEFLDIFSFNFDFAKQFNANSKLQYGAEILYNDMASKAKYTDINTGAITTATTRYPNGGSFFQSYSLYLNYHQKLHEQLSLNAGVRFGYFRYDSKFIADDLFEPIVEDLVMKNKAPSASFGMVYLPQDTWKISGVLASGYRVPNVDDYGKIRAKGDEISVPNPFLKPEYALSTELSITKSFYDEGLLISATAYNTWLFDAILREYVSYNGQDSIEYDNDMYRMYHNSNQHKAIIRGVSAGAHAHPFEYLTLNATINYTHGKVSTTAEPMGHIVPLFGKASAQYRRKDLKLEFYMNYQAQKRLEDMSPYGEDNQDEGTEDGFPAWQTYNIAAQYQLFNSLTLQASVENILDRHYKTFASGISAPGRNFIFSITGRF